MAWSSFGLPIAISGDWNDSVKEKKTRFGQSLRFCWVLRLLGLVTAYTFGGLVHILLVFAVVVLVIQLIRGRRVV
jgi:hypothetical protein